MLIITQYVAKFCVANLKLVLILFVSCQDSALRKLKMQT
jgi:hypothetical protein